MSDILVTALPTDPTSALFRALTTHRTENWRYELLTISGQRITDLTGVVSAEFNYSADSAIKSGGSLVYSGEDLSTVLAGEQLEWLTVLIKPWYRLTTATGETYTWPVGVFVPAAPNISYTGYKREIKIELYDKLVYLDQTKVGSTYTVKKNQNIAQTAKNILTSLVGIPEESIAVSDLNVGSPTDQVWEAGTSTLKIINDLMDSGGYYHVHCDNFGIFKIIPYVEASKISVKWRFIDDAYSVYTPQFSFSQDVFNIPNKVILVSKTESREDIPLVSVAVNDATDIAWSYPVRGRWVTYFEKDLDVSSKKQLDGLATKKLIELSLPAASYQIQHAHLPFNFYEAVVFQRNAENIRDKKAIIYGTNFNTEIGSLMSTTIMEVVTDVNFGRIISS